jgi:hypothetical protein
LCGKHFIAGKLSSLELWSAYTRGKQTYAQLASQYGCSARTIQRKIDQSSISKNHEFPSAVNVLMDTTYFGRTFGVTVAEPVEAWFSWTVLQVRFFTNSM